jgi:hypothetical protein
MAAMLAHQPAVALGKRTRTTTSPVRGSDYLVAVLADFTETSALAMVDPIEELCR